MTVAAVIGLGTMGAGIAAMMARGGMAVRAFDTSAEAVLGDPEETARYRAGARRT